MLEALGSNFNTREKETQAQTLTSFLAEGEAKEQRFAPRAHAVGVNLALTLESGGGEEECSQFCQSKGD